MAKLLSAAFAATALFLGSANTLSPAWAGTCASNCGPRPIQFTPGQRINVEIINLTSSLVQLQKLYSTDPISLVPGEVLQFERVGGTTPNLSLVFWDATSLPLRTTIAQPTPGSLRVEIRPGGRPPGDRSIYILNDGRVNVF